MVIVQQPEVVGESLPLMQLDTAGLVTDGNFCKPNCGYDDDSAEVIGERPAFSLMHSAGHS